MTTTDASGALDPEVDAVDVVADDTGVAGVDGPKVRRTRNEDRWTILRPNGSIRPSATFRSTRTLLFATAAREVRSRYKQNIGRGIWMVVQPAAMVVIYGFVFTEIFQATGEGLPYLSMVWAGIILWQFFQHGVQMGMMSLGYESGTLPKIWFPRVVIPLAPGTSAFFDLGIGMVLLFVTALIQGVRPDYHALFAILPIVVLAVWMYAGALLLAPLAVYMRDLTTIVPLLLRLGFFATPVMYSSKVIPEDLSWLSDWNPVAVCIDGVRDTILAGSYPDWTEVGLQGIVGTVLLVFSFWYFRKVQDRLVDAL
jgi:lipopolysaccharide transport system permease protein